MIKLEKPIKDVYTRTLEDLKQFHDIERSGGLSAKDVLHAHFLIANHFYLEGEGLGGIGPKDANLLLSAVDRQFVAFGGKTKWTDRFDICATLFFGLIKNHAFHDADKRTAFLSVLFLLYRSGYCPSISEKDFEDFTVNIAENSLSRFSRFNNLVKSNDDDPEVKFISWYLRNNTRRIDKQNYSITYRELKTILNRYGFDLRNPSGNYIDIVQLDKRRKYILWGEMEERVIWRCQVGFPRWTVEVGKSALKTVREKTKLSAKDGVDSAAFFKGLDPMQSLIATYNKPLMSLANR